MRSGAASTTSIPHLRVGSGLQYKLLKASLHPALFCNMGLGTEVGLAWCGGGVEGEEYTTIYAQQPKKKKLQQT